MSACFQQQLIQRVFGRYQNFSALRYTCASSPKGGYRGEDRLPVNELVLLDHSATYQFLGHRERKEDGLLPKREKAIEYANACTHTK